jgi:hypothetical protein
MQAEVDFLCLSAQVGPEFVPQLLHTDYELRCVVLEHIDGEGYTEGQRPEKGEIQAAVQFFCLLNADQAIAQRHIKLGAAEGYLRLSEHVANVQNRLARMCIDHLPINTRRRAAELLKRVRAAAETMAQKTLTSIAKGNVADSLDRQNLCVSPSDFGFHNAIRTVNGPKFIDFDFAGWDDPAKVLADFVLQPRVPTGHESLDVWTSICKHRLLPDRIRLDAIGIVLRVKWLTIILSVLQPERLIHILSSSRHYNAEQLIETRIDIAEKYILKEIPFGLH